MEIRSNAQKYYLLENSPFLVNKKHSSIFYFVTQKLEFGEFAHYFLLQTKQLKRNTSDFFCSVFESKQKKSTK